MAKVLEVAHGPAVTYYAAMVRLDTRTWNKMHAQAAQFGLSIQAVVNQCLMWAYFTHRADREIRQRLSVCARLENKYEYRFQVHWPPLIAQRVSDLLIRCSDKCLDPWPGHRAKLGILVEASWKMWATENRDNVQSRPLESRDRQAIGDPKILGLKAQYNKKVEKGGKTVVTMDDNGEVTGSRDVEAQDTENEVPECLPDKG